MIFPIGDTPNPRWFRPRATYLLVALNVLVFLGCLPLMLSTADSSDPYLARYVEVIAKEDGLTSAEAGEVAGRVSAYEVVLFRYGSRPAAPTPTGWLTAMFLHAGVFHLLGNLLFLWIFGDNVERRLGSGTYLGAYLAFGLVAAIGDGALRWGSHLPSVGASGAISGVLGAYFLWFPHNRVRLLVFLPPVIFPLFEVPARLVLGLYLLFDNVLSPLLEHLWGTSQGVAYGAHLGGFAAGLALGWVWVRWLEPRRGLELTDESPEAHLAMARRYLDDRMPTAAYQEVCEVLDDASCAPALTETATLLLSELRERVDLPVRHRRVE